MTEMKAFAEQIAGTMNMEENGTKKFRIWEKRKINGTVFCRERVRCFPGRVPGTVL